MHIGLNISSCRGLGTTQVGMSFLGEIVQSNGPHSFDVWVPDSWDALHSGTEQVQIYRINNSTSRKILVDNIRLRGDVLRCRHDALISLTDTSLPWPGVPHVLFVQQPFLAYEAHKFGVNLGGAWRLKMALMAGYFRLGQGSVDRFVVQTEHMKSALCERWKISEERVEVIPTAVHIPDVQVSSRSNDNADLCVIGSAAPHKNLRIIPRVIELVARRIPEVRCFLTLNETQVPDIVAEAERRGVAKYLRFVGTLSHEEALRLMASARVSVIPSKLESFGLPYWEGLAFGVPMVVSDLVFGREICGEYAEYANPDDAEEWAEKIIKLVEDDSAAQVLSLGARQRFSEISISPGEMVGRFIRVAEEVVE